MSPRLPATVRAVLRLAQLMVPEHRVVDWRRQWNAELSHRRSALGSDHGLVRFSLGAIGHAAYLRREEGVSMLRGAFGDLLFTARSLLRRPAFVVLSLATLGVGIGAVTTVVSVAEAVLWRKLPFPDEDRLTSVYSSNPALGMSHFSVSYPDFVDWTGRGDLFQSASLYSVGDRDISGTEEPQRLIVAGVHSGFFETLGATAHVGRLLADSDQRPDAEPTIVLGHAIWARAFGSDPAIVGQTIRVDGVLHTVVGVSHAEQRWPRSAEAWTPLRYGSTPPQHVARRSNHAFQVVARLQEGVSLATASGQVRAMARTWYSANASGNEQTTEAGVSSLRASDTQGEAAFGFAVMGTAVLLVLLIACINQSNLLLVHSWARARELSLRAALGAGRTRLANLLLGESVLLALGGAAVGVGLAHLALGAISAMIPEGAHELGAQLNAFVLAGTAIVALVASLLAGLTPALKASRASVAETLSEDGGRTGPGRSGVRLRRTLVVVEIALSVVLLSGAGLTIRTFQAQIQADPGLETEGGLIFNVRLPRARYPDEGLVTQYYDEAVSRLEASPGILAASATSSLPLGVARFSTRRVFVMEGAPEPPAGPDYPALWIEVDPHYFDALAVTPIRGRGFTADDISGNEPVLMVNETMARLMSPDQEIVGQRIRSWRDEDLLRQVVGVMPDLQLQSMSNRDGPAVYVPRAQSDSWAMSFLVRSMGDPATTVPMVRSVMKELDGDVALHAMRTLEDAHSDELAGIRTVTMLFGSFGLLALMLAVGGVYGLVATSVAQRTREIGIRMALGGSRGSIREQVMKEGAWLAALGVGIGVVLAGAVSRLLASFLVGIGINWLDVRTLLGVAGVLGASALLASWVPAVRATRVNPVEALRLE
jgi:predicted permease